MKITLSQLIKTILLSSFVLFQACGSKKESAGSTPVTNSFSSKPLNAEQFKNIVSLYGQQMSTVLIGTSYENVTYRRRYTDGGMCTLAHWEISKPKLKFSLKYYKLETIEFEKYAYSEGDDSSCIDFDGEIVWEDMEPYIEEVPYSYSRNLEFESMIYEASKAGVEIKQLDSSRFSISLSSKNYESLRVYNLSRTARFIVESADVKQTTRNGVEHRRTTGIITRNR